MERQVSIETGAAARLDECSHTAIGRARLAPPHRPHARQGKRSWGAGAPAADAFVATPNSALKGRLGRVVVEFPKDANMTSTRIDIAQAGADKSIKGDYGPMQAELLPGKYDVVISKKRVPGAEVASGKDTRIKAGVLRVKAAHNTRVDILDSDQKTMLVGDYGTVEVGLPPGTYYVKVAGQREAAQVRDGEITDF